MDILSNLGTLWAQCRNQFSMKCERQTETTLVVRLLSVNKQTKCKRRHRRMGHFFWGGVGNHLLKKLSRWWAQVKKSTVRFRRGHQSDSDSESENSRPIPI